MSEPLPKENKAKTIRFMILLCTACALILSILATSLQKRQLEAIELNQIKELLIAAKILANNQKSFLLANDQDQYKIANFDFETQMLVPANNPSKPTSKEIFALYHKRVIPLLVDAKGNSYTFPEVKVNFEDYLKENARTGYAQLPLKLVYKILQNNPKTQNSNVAECFVLPVNGFGLWDAIYGYIALKPDGDTVIGTTWYEQKETPGLGAEISTFDWQKQFFGKLVFQKNTDGTTNLQKSRIGLTVVKGTVKEVYGTSPRSKSAVDGLTGATETGKGVTNAYRDSLSSYRAFLIKLHESKQ